MCASRLPLLTDHGARNGKCQGYLKTFLPRGGGNSYMEQTRVLVGNFEFNP